MTDDTYTVQRSVTIDAPPERIYDQLADFHHWKAWSPWEDIDPQLNRTFSGPEAGVGAQYAWSGNRKAGQGRMEITEAVPPGKVQIDLHFEKPFKARNDTWFIVEPQGSGSRVIWTMTGKKTFMTKVMGIFKSMDSLIGGDFEKGLGRLKTATERPATG